MGAEVAVAMAQLGQQLRQQAEVVGLLGGDADPVQVERARQALEPPGGVEREVDGVELDVG